MQQVIGTVTIGQAPRTDVTPEIAPILGPNIRIEEAGALDGLSKEEIAALAPEQGDYVLVTRLADGSSVQVAERHITPRLIEKIQGHFAKGIPLVLLLCTGEFPGFGTDGLLVRPQRILYNTVAALGENLRLGVLMPSADQHTQSQARWKQLSDTVASVAASPYVDAMAAVECAAHELKDWGAQLTVMDCIGYTVPMQQLVREITGKPVILARGIAARTVKELLG